MNNKWALILFYYRSAISCKKTMKLFLIITAVLCVRLTIGGTNNNYCEIGKFYRIRTCVLISANKQKSRNLKLAKKTPWINYTHAKVYKIQQLHQHGYHHRTAESWCLRAALRAAPRVRGEKRHCLPSENRFEELDPLKANSWFCLNLFGLKFMFVIL